MANLHKRSVQEALNATVGGVWGVNSAGTAGSSADVANTIHLSLATMTSTLGVYSAVEIYFNFAVAETSVNASNDMIIPKIFILTTTQPVQLLEQLEQWRFRCRVQWLSLLLRILVMAVQ